MPQAGPVVCLMDGEGNLMIMEIDFARSETGNGTVAFVMVCRGEYAPDKELSRLLEEIPRATSAPPHLQDRWALVGSCRWQQWGRVRARAPGAWIADSVCCSALVGPFLFEDA